MALDLVRLFCVALFVGTAYGFLVEDSTDPPGNTTPRIQGVNGTLNETNNVNITVCYGSLGCFSNIPPYDNGALLLPQSPEYLDTTFWLFTRQNSNWRQVGYNSGFDILGTGFNPKRPTKIVAHGFTQNSSIYWMQDMKKGFLSVGDFNVILVDWGNGAAFPNYPQCVANVRIVGTQLYHVIRLMERAGASLRDVHCIGHSLGAHVCGHTGMLLKGKLGRISGLDVAGPEYEDLDPAVRLDATDAIFVDATHTNSAPIFVGGLGIHQTVGHIDFYVNGGETQPGCPSITDALGTILHNAGEGLQAGKKALSCSHSRSHKLFVESITTSCPFYAYPCEDAESFEAGNCTGCGAGGCARLGYHADQNNARGKMFVDTSAARPYCGYQYFIRMETNATDTKGKVMVKLIGSKGSSLWTLATRQEDDDLRGGHPVNRAVVSSQDVGVIWQVKVVYSQSKGFWFFGGKVTWDFSRMVIVTGTSSQRYVVCSKGTPLHDGIQYDFHTQEEC